MARGHGGLEGNRGGHPPALPGILPLPGSTPIRLQDSPDFRQWVRSTFEEFDTDHSGKIGRPGLERLLCGEHGCITPDEVEAALREADRDGDGELTFEEFSHLITQGHLSSLELFPSRRKARSHKATDAAARPLPPAPSERRAPVTSTECASN